MPSAATALLAGAVGAGTVVMGPAAPAAAIGATVAGLLILRFGVATLICVFVAYHPFEPLVLSHLPSGLVPATRYGPELLLWLLAAVALARLGEHSLRALQPILLALLLIVGIAVLAAIASDVGAGRAIIGLRGELRYAPLVAIVPWAFPLG